MGATVEEVGVGAVIDPAGPWLGRELDSGGGSGVKGIPSAATPDAADFAEAFGVTRVSELF